MSSGPLGQEPPRDSNKNTMSSNNDGTERCPAEEVPTQDGAGTVKVAEELSPAPCDLEQKSSETQKALGLLIVISGMVLSILLGVVLFVATNMPSWVLFVTLMAVIVPTVVVGTNLQGDRPITLRAAFVPRKVEDLSPEEKRQHDDFLYMPMLLFAIAVFVGGGLLLALLAFQVARLIPAGDEWWKAAIRVVYASSAIAGAYLLFRWSTARFRVFASRRLPPRFLELWEGEQKSPPSWPSVLADNWTYLAAAVLCVLLICRVIDLNAKLFDFGDARKIRAFFLLVQWARGNPNTAILSSVVFGTAALGIYIAKAWTAFRSQSSSTT